MSLAPVVRLPHARIDIDARGICTRLYSKKRVVNLHPDGFTVGKNVADISDTHVSWILGRDRYDRNLSLLRRTGDRCVWDYHMAFYASGELMMHCGEVRRWADGRGATICYEVPMGSRTLRMAMGRVAFPFIVGLGESTLACILDRHDRTWWWSLALAERTGCADVLGGPPPVEILGRLDSHAGWRVRLGRRPGITASMKVLPLNDHEMGRVGALYSFMVPQPMWVLGGLPS